MRDARVLAAQSALAAARGAATAASAAVSAAAAEGESASMRDLSARVAAFTQRAQALLAQSSAGASSASSTSVNASAPSVSGCATELRNDTTVLRRSYQSVARAEPPAVEVFDSPLCPLARLLNTSTHTAVPLDNRSWRSVDHYLLHLTLLAAALPGPAQSMLTVPTVAVAHLVASQALAKAKDAQTNAGALPVFTPHLTTNADVDVNAS